MILIVKRYIWVTSGITLYHNSRFNPLQSSYFFKYKPFLFYKVFIALKLLYHGDIWVPSNGMF